MAKSSINFQQSSGNAFEHNDREHSPDYVFKEKSHLNECNRTAKEAHKLYKKLREEAIRNYTKRTGQKIQTKEERFRWSAVINLNAHHTLKDLEELAKIFEDKFGWQPLQIAIHKDEGHKDDNGEFKNNYHAHIEFFMLDKQGIYRFKKNEFNTKKMSEIQDLTAKVLQMERGINYHQANVEREARGEQRQKTPKHQNHVVYKHNIREKEKLKAQHKQELEQQPSILSKKERNEIIEQERKDSAGQGFTQKFFRALSALKKGDTEFTKEELLAEIERLKELNKQQELEIKELQKENQELILENSNYEIYTKRISQELEQEKETVKYQQVQINRLESENKSLKHENSQLKEFIKNAFDYIRKVAKPTFDFIKDLFTNSFTAPLLNELEKDKEFIEKNQETQQRSNLSDYEGEIKSIKDTIIEDLKKLPRTDDILNEPESEKEKEIKIKRQR